MLVKKPMIYLPLNNEWHLIFELICMSKTNASALHMDY